jgi:hypothetical protein
MRKTLALIFAALALMIGSFVWFVMTWDASEEKPISSVGPYQTHTGSIPNPYGVL